jgi:hypothetical protein
MGPVKVAEAVTNTTVMEASGDDKASVVLEEESSDCWFCCVDGCAVSVSLAPALKLVVSVVVVPEVEAVAVTSAVTWTVVKIVV